MDSANYFDSHLGRVPVIGIFRNLSPLQTVALCHRAWAFGVDLIEVPVQSPSALPSLQAAITAGRDAGKQVGAGTVTTVEQLLQVHELGAAFTVAPGLNTDVADRSRALGLPHLPGVATSSEIGLAVMSGFRWLKAFPAAQLGSAWVRAQLAPFPTVSFVATGGIEPGNVREFLAAGCRAVAVGSAFENEATITALAEELHRDSNSETPTRGRRS